MDLQLFGKSRGAKRSGKNILMLGCLLLSVFGGGGPLLQGLMMVALFSSIWGMNSKDKQQSNGATIMRFDRMQENMSLGQCIPVVYGRRMITGNQTFHETDADANNLHKHVVLCEGGDEALETATANGYLIPVNGVYDMAAFTIQNVKYEDAWVELTNKTLRLYANGELKEIALKNTDDVNNDEASFWQWQVDVSALISYINRWGKGWEAFPTATTSMSAGDLVIGTYVGRFENRLDTEIDEGRQPNRWEEDGHTYIYVPGTYYQETHWHHFRQRLAHYIMVDLFRNERLYCYKNPVPVKATQTVGITSFAVYDGNCPPNYEQCGSYARMAWLDLNFAISDNIGGNPTIEALVRGRRVYDTRIGQWVYSTNPAMCLRDLLLNPDFGGGSWINPEDIDEQSFIEAANYCDAPVQYELCDGTVVEQRRFELNLVMDNRQTLWDWCQAILATFQGFLVLSRNKIHLRIEKRESVSYRFDESTIKDLSISQTSLDECPNQYKVKFVDPLNNWKTATVVVDDASDQRERKKIVVKEVELEGVTTQAQALRLARFYRDYNKTCTLQVEFKTGYEAVHLEPADVITLSFKQVFFEAPFRITEIRESADGEYTIKARQYNDTIYNDQLGATVTAYNYSTKQATFGTPWPVSNVKAETIDDILGYPITKVNAKISWSETVTNLLVTYEIYRQYSGGEWEHIGTTTTTELVVQEPQNAFVRYGVIVVSGLGIQSARTYSDWTLLYLEDKPPKAPQHINVSVNDDDFDATWDMNQEPDFDHYEVRIWGDVYKATSNHFHGKGKDGWNEISIIAIDKGGNRAESTTRFLMTIKPRDIEWVIREVANGYVTLKWQKSKGATYYTVTGDANVMTYNTSVILYVGKVGTFTYYVQAHNDLDTSNKYKVVVDFSEEDNPEGTLYESFDLFNGITMESNAMMVVEDGEKTIIKKEI